MITPELAISQTKKWITDVVIGCNFCPFASKEIKHGTVHYQVEQSIDMATCLESFMKECARLDEEQSIVTSLLIFPESFRQFDDFLDLVEATENALEQNDYDGIYQVASFHPQYIFDGAPVNDAANYTNRSIYPMLHLLREAQIDEALERYPNPEKIPENNIHFARNKGVQYMKLLRDTCMEL
jgi:uncharacterized protein